MIPPGFEPGTFHVLGERDNHYTTETTRPVVSSDIPKNCMTFKFSKEEDSGNTGNPSSKGLQFLKGPGLGFLASSGARFLCASFAPKHRGRPPDSPVLRSLRSGGSKVRLSPRWPHVRQCGHSPSRGRSAP